MKIAFLITRLVNYREMGPLIEEGIDRGHKIELWHDYTHPKKGMKGYQFPYVEKSPFFGTENVEFRTANRSCDYSNLVANSQGIAYYVSIHPVFFPMSDESIEKISGKWCVLQHGFDTYWEIREWNRFRKNPLLQDCGTKYFYYTDRWQEAGQLWVQQNAIKDGLDNYKYFDDRFTKKYPIGFPRLSDKVIQSIRLEDIRKKYNVPCGKQVLVYLPFPFYPPRNKGTKNASWQLVFSGLDIKTISGKEDSVLTRYVKTGKSLIRKLTYIGAGLRNKDARTWMFKGWNEVNVIRTIRKFCDQNDLFFVTKSRSKFPLVKEAYTLSDLVVTDQAPGTYPSEINELFSIARLGVGYVSSSVLDAVSWKVPYINLDPGERSFMNEAHKALYPTINGSQFSFEGVVWNYDIRQFIQQFGSTHCADYLIDVDRFNQYVDQFFGSEGSGPAEKFYQVLESEQGKNL
jgi:hypothetical protein